MGADEVNYKVHPRATFRERWVFALTGSINGDTSKIYKFNSTDTIGKRNFTAVTFVGCFVLYQIWSSKKKNASKT